MELFDGLALGIASALTPENFMYCVLGVVLGTLVGVLPGLGALATISILLPLTYKMADPTTALIMLAGIYYGAQYGGSTTSILLRVPGEVSSTVTAIDGYEMSRRGRSGSALSIAAISSFVAGTFATALIAFLAVPMANFALQFGPAEYAALMFFAVIVSLGLAQGDVFKAAGVLLIGMLLGSIGIDINTGVSRFTMGLDELYDGLPFILIAIGVFGLAEILYDSLHRTVRDNRDLKTPTMQELYPNAEERRRSWPACARGTVVGSFLGLLPGAGTVLASFGSYILEKKISATSQQFGHGAPEGVAAPEAANNAGSQTSFIPMLALGLPATPIMALMISVLMLHGIEPGPKVIQDSPALFWGLIVSMWIGNVILVILNLPLIAVWVQVLRIPRPILYAGVLAVCVAGTWWVSHNWIMVALLVPFALFGYVLKRLGCEPALLALGFIVGGLFEEYLKRALMLGRGDWMILFNSWISISFMILSVTVLFFRAVFWYHGRQQSTLSRVG